MVHKRISIYGELGVQSPFNNDQLLLEVSNTHMALLVKLAGKNHAVALEIFDFDSSVNSWYDIFYHVRLDSKVLDRSYNDTRVYFNLDEALIIPLDKFSANASDAYLTTIYGDNINHVVKYDNINAEPELINLFRIKKDLNDMVNSNLMMVTPRHLYSKLLEDVFSNPAKIAKGNFLKIQFYYHQMLIVLMKDGQLQLIQSYSFQTADDVLYYLLNITQQFGLSPQEIQVEISGLIDIKSQKFEYIQKVFSKISFDTISNENFFRNYIGEYPLHYFSPFLNLIV